MSKNYSKEYMLSLYSDEQDKKDMINIQKLNTTSRSRVDEIIKYAKISGFKKIGIAHCISFGRQTRRLVEILEDEFELVTVDCKVGRIPKSELCEEGFGAACNPIVQAQVLNDAQTDMNIVMGLCVGHDMLFTKHSKAPSTTLLIKDEVNNNEPIRGFQ